MPERASAARRSAGMQPVRRVRTNLILGALGVGKTTAIRGLLARAPADERWAVLVNEFGEVGIDAALLGGGTRVREVAGGCMCCAAGVGTQVAVAAILRDLRPDRLLIEPSGLGHPGGIVDLLRAPPLSAGIDLRAVIGLLDAREFSAARWRDSALYREQITLPDVLVLAKSDLAGAADIDRLTRFLATLYPPKRLDQGPIAPAWLDATATRALPADSPAASPPAGGFTRVATGIAAWPAPAVSDGEVAFGRHEQVSDGVAACGWRWPPETGFSRPRLLRLCAHLGRAGVLREIRRIKGVLRTGKAWQLLNGTPDGVTVDDIVWRRDSRIELIAMPGAPPDWAAIEQALEACMT